MISGEFTRKVDVDAEILMTPIRTLYASGDKNAHTFELSLYRNKEPLKIDGAGVIGYFLRADGYTVPVNGTASGNVAKVRLAESCYAVVGQFNLIIKVTVGSERKAVFWGNGYVTRSQTDSVIDPGKTIPSLDELLAQIAAVEAATKAANTAASTANTAASNADKKASIADTAASTAIASAKTADASAAAADKATASANAAAGKIDGMTVAASGLPAGSPPTAKLTEEDGHYKLTFGLTKGDTGASGVYTGPDEPTDPDIDVWINPDGTPLSEIEILWQVADHIYQGVDLTVKFADEIKKYANPWAWIKARIAAGDYTGIHVGDYIPMTTDNNLTFKMQIAGIDTYTRYGSTEVKHHIDFISKTLWPTTVKMNMVDFNNGVSDAVKSPWLASNAYHYINSLAGSVPNSKAVNPEMLAVDYTNDGIYSHLPAEVKAAIAEKIVYLPTRYSASGLQSKDNSGEWKSVGKLWIPSEFEVLGAYNSATSGWMANGWQQYPIFANNMGRVKGTSETGRNGWWLLSALSGSTTGFVSVYSGGYVNYGSASSARCVPLCFRIS